MLKDRPDIRRFHFIGSIIVLGGLAVRLVLSATTFGTNDVTYFSGFARTVRELGPVGIYHVPFDIPYNHPPLVGWMLTGVNWIADRGLSFPFALRILPILADVAATVLVMRVARRRFNDRAGLVAGALVAFSPVLILVSGAHGNFDTVFCALILLSLFLMVEKRWPLAAGAVGAIAVGVKLVPLVVIPVIALSGANRRALSRYAAAFVVVSSAIWIPAMARESHGIVENVLGYRGQYGQWGLAELATLLGVQRDTISSVLGIMGLFASGLSMLLGVWYLIRTRYRSPYAAAGLALTVLLFLSPAWGAQYMSWPVTLILFIGTGLAVSYSIAAGAFLFVVYTAWSGGFPLDRIRATPRVSPLGVTFGLLAWALLGAAAASALARAHRIDTAVSPAPEFVHPHLPETADR